MNLRMNKPSDVGLCLYAKGQVQVLQAWQIWGTPFLHLIALQLALKKAVRRFGTMPMFVKRLSQKFIAAILVRCDKHVPGGSTAGAALCTTSFGRSWLALLALSKGCFPSRFRHVCHVLAFSVSPIGAGLCSCQQAALEVHLRQSVQRLLQTNGASGSRLTSSTIPIGFRVFRTMPKHMLMQNSQKLHFTRPQLKASLPLKDLCIFLWWSYCNVNFGMVEACLPLPAETRHRGAYRIKLKSPEAAWNRNPCSAETWLSVLASLMI